MSETKRRVPSIGCIVHYVEYNTNYNMEGEAGAHRAAIVTEAHNLGESDSVLSLCVLNPTGMDFKTYIYHDEAQLPNTWHWPEHVPAV